MGFARLLIFVGLIGIPQLGPDLKGLLMFFMPFNDFVGLLSIFLGLTIF